MITERLSILTVLHCYKHWEIDIEKVIYSFAVMKKRRFGFLFATRIDIDDQNWLRRTEELRVYV